MMLEPVPKSGDPEWQAAYGQPISVPRLKIVDDVPVLAFGAEHWQLTVAGCALVLVEGDFTIALNVASCDVGSIGAASFACVGAADAVMLTFKIKGNDYMASLNKAIETLLIKALVTPGWWRLHVKL